VTSKREEHLDGEIYKSSETRNSDRKWQMTDVNKNNNSFSSTTTLNTNINSINTNWDSQTTNKPPSSRSMHTHTNYLQEQSLRITTNINEE